jgi:protein TonB
MFTFRMVAILLWITAVPLWSQSNPASGAGSSSTSAQLTETPAGSQLPHLSEKDMRHLARKKVQPVGNQITSHLRGAVVLGFTIDKSGAPINIRLVSGNPLLSGPSIDAVKQWRFKPYLVNGKPVEVETEITFEYPVPCVLQRC